MPQRSPFEDSSPPPDSPRPALSLLVPTRGRPHSLGRLLDSLAATTARPGEVEVVLVLDDDDLPSLAVRDDRLRLRRVVGPPGRTMGELNSAGWEAAAGEFLMLLNDDVVVRTPGWDELVRARLRPFADGIVLGHVNDTLMRENLCTFPIVSRTFCELAGGICPRGYVRYRIDDHIEDVFNLLAVLGERRTVYLREVVFAHENFVEMPGGHREYHADPDLLAVDAPRFQELFSQRKELALALLDHIEAHRQARRRQLQRQFLDAIDDPFSLRIPGRQLGAQVPRKTLAGRLAACYRRGGVAALARAAGRRLRARLTCASSPGSAPASPRSSPDCS